MVDYYELLQIPRDASTQQIKRSFRRRAKEVHPDVNASDHSFEEEMRLLLAGYQVLVNPEKREEYDRGLAAQKRRYRFDYREYLMSRRYDLFCQSKLVFYDLLNARTEDAVALYNDLDDIPNFQLENYLTREDYMDCAFLLAEAFDEREEYVKAWKLYTRVYIFETERPYFRHFVDELIDRLRNLVCFKMVRVMTSEAVIGYLQKLVTYEFSKKDTAFFYKKIAEIYSSLGDNDNAVYYLSKGLQLHDKLAGVKKLMDKIGYREVASM